MPDPLVEQLNRPVVRLGLHVLGEAERDRAGLGGIRQDSHRRQQGRRQLFGTPDPVEVPRDRPESVVHRDVARVRKLQFLQQR